MRDALLTENITSLRWKLYIIEFCANLGHCSLWSGTFFDARL